jgi:hypothetical protein
VTRTPQERAARRAARQFLDAFDIAAAGFDSRARSLAGFSGDERRMAKEVLRGPNGRRMLATRLV